ncbi:MAG TPA: hypothetical protein PK760_02960, partial [Flavobacteriales bacterium]|nr:hypothetical protein [Flavobacteriales bacterium]
MARIHSFAIVLLATLLLLVPRSVSAQNCLGSYTFTASPLPVNGQYQCGQVVTFCITITNWNTTNANWLHGIVPVLGPGWDASTLQATVTSPTQGGSGGTWDWFNIDTPTNGNGLGPVGPGFFFDLNNDGVPGNNFGDYVNGPCNFQFCWSVAVATGAACQNGLDLSMTASVYGDSETGSWGAVGCNGDINPLLPATTQACQADAGTPGIIAVCEDYPLVDLFAQLGGTPDATGVWTDPNGTVSIGTVDPATGLAGVYTYSVTEPLAGCPVVTSTVTVGISYNMDAGLPNTLTLCEDAAVLDMFASLNGTPTPGGTWTAPDGTAWSGNYLAATDPQGAYTYTVVPAAPCLAHSATLTLTMHPAPWAGDDSHVTKCANNESFPLFPLLSNSPDAGGAWFDPALVPHADLINPPTDYSGAYDYVVYGTDECVHLIDTSTIAVIINPLPRVAFVAEPDSGCAPLSTTLINTTPPE